MGTDGHCHQSLLPRSRAIARVTLTGMDSNKKDQVPSPHLLPWAPLLVTLKWQGANWQARDELFRLTPVLQSRAQKKGRGNVSKGRPVVPTFIVSCSGAHCSLWVIILTAPQVEAQFHLLWSLKTKL